MDNDQNEIDKAGVDNNEANGMAPNLEDLESAEAESGVSLEDGKEDEANSGKTETDKLETKTQEELVKIAKSAIAQKIQYRTKLEAINKVVIPQKSAEEKMPSENTGKSEDTGGLAREIEILNFKQDNPTIERATIKKIQNFAKSQGISLEKAVSDPIIGSFIKDEQARVENDKASVSGSGYHPLEGTNGKKLDFETMSDEDFAKYKEAVTKTH